MKFSNTERYIIVQKLQASYLPDWNISQLTFIIRKSRFCHIVKNWSQKTRDENKNRKYLLVSL